MYGVIQAQLTTYDQVEIVSSIARSLTTMAPWFVTIGLFLGSVAATSISDEWKTALDNRYIVSLKSGLSPVDVEQHRRSVSVAHSKRNVGDSSEFVGIDKIYDVGTYHGYAGSFDAVTMAEIEADDNVCY